MPSQTPSKSPPSKSKGIKNPFINNPKSLLRCLPCIFILFLSPPILSAYSSNTYKCALQQVDCLKCSTQAGCMQCLNYVTKKDGTCGGRIFLSHCAVQMEGEDKCTMCSKWYKLNAEGQCEKIPATNACIRDVEVGSKMKCIQCKANYAAKDGEKCMKESLGTNTISHCKYYGQFVDGKPSCYQCEERFASSGQSSATAGCIQGCPKGCRLCNIKTRTVCTECDSDLGYFMSAPGKCDNTGGTGKSWADINNLKGFALLLGVFSYLLF